MLHGIERFLQRLRQWYPAEKEIDEFLEVYSDDIVKAIKAQLASGIDGNGDPVYLDHFGKKSYEYKWSTVVKKEKYGVGLGAVWDRITNYKTGAFYSSIYVNILGDGKFEVLASDWKFDLIKTRSGEHIIDLSPQAEMFLMTNKIAPEFQAGINAIFYEKF